MKKSIFYLLIIPFAITIIAASCTTNTTKEVAKVNYPITNCVDSKNQRTTLKWGNLDRKTEKIFNSYILKTNGVIESITSIADTSGVFVAKVPDSLYCPVLPDFAKLILRNETLNVRADTMTFIIYENPTNDFVKRYIWNNKFDRPDLLNRDYRIFYIRLETLKDLYK